MRISDKAGWALSAMCMSCALLAVPPAHAEGWTSTHVPGTLEAGDKVCMLYSGTVLPAVSVGAYEGSSALTLQASVLNRVASGTEATLSFPSGASLPVRLAKSSPESDIIVVALASVPTAGVASFEDVLAQFSKAGSFSAAGTGWRVDIPALPEASAGIRAVKSCKVGLENAAAFEQGIAALKAEDFETAYILWKPIADKGYAMAQLMLGILYDEGAGVAHDEEEADRLICAAAASGLEQAADVAADFEIDCSARN